MNPSYGHQPFSAKSKSDKNDFASEESALEQIRNSISLKN